LSEIKNRVQSFLLGEFYLFWAAGLTAGIYLGSRNGYFNRHIIAAEFVSILFLLILEIIIIRRLSKKFPLDSSLVTLSKGSFKPDPESNILKIFVRTVIPFFILMAIGNSIIIVYQYNQGKKILLAISNSSIFCSDGMTIEGRISSHPDYYFGSLNFLLETGSVYVYDRSGNLKSFHSVNEPLNVRFNGEVTPPLLRDDYLRLRGDLKKGDPGKPEIIEGDCLYFDVKEGNQEKIEFGSLASKIFNIRGRFYRCIKNTFYRSLEAGDACIAEALILGDRSNIPEHISEDFKDCGVYHLFAISGIHISFFISMIYILIRKIKPSFISFLAAMVILGFYNFLTGGRASTVRASFVFIFIFLASNWNREYNQRFLLYISYIIILLFNPFFFYDLGLWMSFGSMAAIIFIYPVARKIAGRIFPFFKSRVNLIIKTGLMTFSIQAALFPVLAYFFKKFSLISPVANILILPVFYILLFILVASSFVSVLWPPAGCLLARLSAIFFSYISVVVKTLSGADFLILNFSDYSIKDAAIYYAIFLVILSAALIIIRKNSSNKRNRD
jgi:ComEC/Rec2-related protein